VSTEHSRVQIKLPNAPELVGAVVGAADHLAQRAGFDEEARSALLHLAEQAARDQVAELPRNDSALEVTLEDFADRIELTFEHEIGKGATTSVAAKPAADYPQADHVEAEIRGGTSHLKLTKYAHGRK
jgi:hypothetical protein